MLQSNLTAIHPKIWLANFRLAEKSGSHVRLLKIKLNGIIAHSSTYTQWKKTATISLIIRKPSKHTKLHSPTRRSGVELTTTTWVTQVF